MAYWIHENGETLGPMRAIDVLRRAQPSTRICDGEIWFLLEDEDPAVHANAGNDELAIPEYLVIRSQAG